MAAYQHTDNDSSTWAGMGDYPAFRHRELFDHELCFRQVGARGPSGWKNCALVGRPYNVFGRDGEVLPSALASADEVAALYGVGVWTWRDLSNWVPGWTSLVLAAPDLSSEDTMRFGFVALSGADNLGRKAA